MSTEIVEELVLAKLAAQQESQRLLALVGVLALQHGGSVDSNGAIEYRLTKAKVSKIEGHGIDIRSLKTGGVVITVKKAEDE